MYVLSLKRWDFIFWGKTRKNEMKWNDVCFLLFLMPMTSTLDGHWILDLYELENVGNRKLRWMRWEGRRWRFDLRCVDDGQLLDNFSLFLSPASPLFIQVSTRRVSAIKKIVAINVKKVGEKRWKRQRWRALNIEHTYDISFLPHNVFSPGAVHDF